MIELIIGMYYVYAIENNYTLTRLSKCPTTYKESKINAYDCTLNYWLTKHFKKHCLTSGQIKELLRDQNSVTKPMLQNEPELRRLFSNEEFEKLSPLWIAVLGCYMNCTELLVCSGIDVNEPFGHHDPQIVDKKWTVLHVLLQMRSLAKNERTIRLVIDHGADLEAQDSYGRTALHFAIMHERVEQVKLLLNRGVHVNVADDNGVTPLLATAALETRNANTLLPLLMEHGADVTAKDKSGQNALHHLANATHDLDNMSSLDVQDMRDRRNTAQVDLARFLIQKGVSVVDQQNFSQYQPIHLAALKGRNKLVSFFLDQGVNVNAQTRDGQTPLHMATRSDKNEVLVEDLLKRGADVDLRTFDGCTSLHNACRNFNRKKIELLLSAGANMLVEDHHGKTPLACISFNNMMYITDIELILKELALKKVCQSFVELKDETIIRQEPELQNYYQDCQAHLSRMKDARLINSCTFLDLLAKGHECIAELMRNPEFEINFKRYDVTEFSMYTADINRAFERAQCHRNFMLEQEKEISDAAYFLPYVVTRKVVSYSTFACCERTYAASQKTS